MRTDHVFPHVREDAKRKRLRSQTKEVVANVYNYFEEIHRCQRTQGPHVRINRLQRKKVDTVYDGFIAALNQKDNNLIIILLIKLIIIILIEHLTFERFQFLYSISSVYTIHGWKTLYMNLQTKINDNNYDESPITYCH